VSNGLLFAVSCGVGLIAFILMRWWVREPRCMEKFAV